MVKSSIDVGIVTLLAVLLCTTAGFAQPSPPPAAGPQAAAAGVGQSVGSGMEAMKHAADAHKYLFLFFHGTDDEQTRALRDVFDATMRKIADRAESVVVSIADPRQKDVVAKFKVDRAPMPLVLTLAPNGAVTGAYPLKFDEQMLMTAFCSRSTWEALKALQEGKLVFLCVQNASTKFGAEAMKAVQEVNADPKYAKLTEIVIVDPRDTAEADALKRLSIGPDLDEAVTILLAPPATIINRFKGAATKDAIVAEIVKAAAGRGGCCPGRSCGPKPSPTTTQPGGATGKPPPPSMSNVPRAAPSKGAPQPNTSGTKPQTSGTTAKP